MSEAIAHCKAVIGQVVNIEQPTWESLVAPLEQADDRLSRIWSPISHMNSVVSEDAMRAAHDACLELLSDYSTWVGQHEGLYNAYMKLAQSEGFSELSTAQQRVITDTLRDFELSGVALPAEQKKRYGEIQNRLSQLSSQFSNQLLDATHAWFAHVTDESELAGFTRERSCSSSRGRARERTRRLGVYARYSELLTSNDVCRKIVRSGEKCTKPTQHAPRTKARMQVSMITRGLSMKPSRCAMSLLSSLVLPTMPKFH